MPWADVDLRETAIDEALADYVRAPNAYCPARGALGGWLATNAANGARDLERAVRRRSSHETAAGIDLSRYGPAASDEEAQEHDDDRWLRARRRQWLALTKTPEERTFLTAWLVGQPIAQLAAILGCAADPIRYQRKCVKRMKERLAKRCRRALPFKGSPVSSRKGAAVSNLGHRNRKYK